MNNTKFNTKILVLCSLFAALTAIGAFIKIPIPMLPFTLQSFFAVMAGIVLGKKWGAVSVGAYTAIGILGIPVFTAGGGPAYLLKPSFGYILGFILAAYVAGKVMEILKVYNPKNITIASMVAGLSVYVIGVPYFFLITTLYLKNSMTISALLVNCFLLTVPADMVKAVLVGIVSPRIIKGLKSVSN